MTILTRQNSPWKNFAKLGFIISSHVGITLQRARRRMEHHLTRIGLGRNRKPVISREATPGQSGLIMNIDFQAYNK